MGSNVHLNMATQSGMPLYWRRGWAMILSTARGLVTRASTHSRLRRALRVTSLWHPSEERLSTTLRTASWNSCPRSFNAVDTPYTLRQLSSTRHFFFLNKNFVGNIDLRNLTFFVYKIVWKQNNITVCFNYLRKVLVVFQYCTFILFSNQTKPWEFSNKIWIRFKHENYIKWFNEIKVNFQKV